MAKPLAVPVDAERATSVLLLSLLTGRGEDVTVGVELPEKWKLGSKAHVQVALDGTPEVLYPVRARATVRITVWHDHTTNSKRLANLCMGLLLSYPGDRDVASYQALTGVLPATDPDTKADLASITVRAVMRFTAL